MWRDRACYGLLAVTVLIGLTSVVAFWPVVVGAGLAVLVGVGVRRGFLGPAWVDAAVPLATAVAVPFILFPYELLYTKQISTCRRRWPLWPSRTCWRRATRTRHGGRGSSWRR